MDEKILTPEQATEVRARLREEGKRLVFTNGCFDLLHVGHARLLRQAAALGDFLVVGLNSDASVRRLKGPSRPIVAEDARAELLAALECVDAVAVFGEDTPECVLAELRPHLWVKGGDYRVGDLPEAPLLETWGGQAVVLPYVPGKSTSSLIERVRRILPR